MGETPPWAELTTWDEDPQVQIEMLEDELGGVSLAGTTGSPLQVEWVELGPEWNEQIIKRLNDELLSLDRHRLLLDSLGDDLMRQVRDFFQGRSTEADVFRAARAWNQRPEWPPVG